MCAMRHDTHIHTHTYMTEKLLQCAHRVHERAENKREGVEKGPKVARAGRSSH